MLRLVVPTLLLFCSAVVLSKKSSNVRVSSSVKDQILNSEDLDSAYQMYVSSYEESRGPAALMAMDPLTHQRETERKRSNFVRSLTSARAHNARYERGESRYRMTVNAFSVMDEEEKNKYLGSLTANLTRTAGQDPEEEAKLGGVPSNESSLSWRQRGFVTPSFDQGECGSCWTFPAIALVEFALKQTTGKLLQLSNQQLLDCTYEYVAEWGAGYDGCEGGLYEHAWDYLLQKQHLAALSKYKYREVDNECGYELYPNELEGRILVKGYKEVFPRVTDRFIEVLQQSPAAVAIYAEDELHSYDTGLYDGCLRDRRRPNHAVLLTGYGPDYWEIRNSWGQDWGSNGYMKFYRGAGTNLCCLLDWGMVMKYTRADQADVSESTIKHRTTTEPITMTSSTSTYDRNVQISDISEEMMSVSESDRDIKTTFTLTTSSSISQTQQARVTTRQVEDRTSYSASLASTTEPSQHRECDPGQHFNGYTCQACPENHYSGYGTNVCISCPSGTASKSGSSSASDCVEPREQCYDYKAKCSKLAAQGHCTKPAQTAYMETKCRLSCGFCTVSCEAGSFLNTRAECEVCPGDTYSEYKSTECKRCPAGSSSGEGSTDISDCVTECDDVLNEKVCQGHQTRGNCNKDKIRAKCALTCGACEAARGRCLNLFHNEDLCLKWKDQGLCHDPEVGRDTRVLCSKTCGTCREKEEAVCQDSQEYGGGNGCSSWASAGYCDDTQYRAFMLHNCKASCDSCEGGSVTEYTPVQTATPTPTTTEPVLTTTTPHKEEEAVSDDAHCWREGYVALNDRHSGHRPVAVVFTDLQSCIQECKQAVECVVAMVNPARSKCHMLREDYSTKRRQGWQIAEKDCFTASDFDQEDPCQDSAEYSDRCGEWATKYCTAKDYSQFMGMYCRASCGMCVDDSTNLKCVDNPSYLNDCPKWTQEGYCDNSAYGKWMKQNCFKSCDLCCLDNEKYKDDCLYWANSGYCSSGKFTQFMSKNCPQTCGECGDQQSEDPDYGSGSGRGSKHGKKKGQGQKSRGSG